MKDLFDGDIEYKECQPISTYPVPTAAWLDQKYGDFKFQAKGGGKGKGGDGKGKGKGGGKASGGKGGPPKGGCFICGGLHWASECVQNSLNKNKPNASPSAGKGGAISVLCTVTEVQTATLGTGHGPREAVRIEVESENPVSPLQTSDEEGMLPLTDSESEEEESESSGTIAHSIRTPPPPTLNP